MPQIKSFRAVRPTPELAAQVASVPYDVVNRAEAAQLAEGNEHSFLHVVRPDIDLPADTDPYANEVYSTARGHLDRLRSEGILVQDDSESLFVYRQTMNGQSQTGVVCCCHVDDYENNLILKHEKTRPAKEDDRTRHVVTLNAHAGPIFLTYRDIPDVNTQVAAITAQPPLYDFVAADGVGHTVWQVTDCANLIAAMSASPAFYVADGHHRAASAWRAAQQRAAQNPNHTGTEEYNWFLTVLFPAGELTILPYNRIIADLNGHTPDDIRAKLSELGVLEPAGEHQPQMSGRFAIYLDGGWWQLTLPADSIDAADPIESLDVALLERRILEPIFGITDVRRDPRIDFVGGIRGTKELERRVDSGDWACAVSMYATTIDQLMSVADAGEVMPPKSTWFEPKLRSGLLVHLLD